MPVFSFIFGYIILARLLTPESFEMPSLLGLNVYEAFPVLSRHNLNARIMHIKEDADVDEGTILEHRPYPQQKVKAQQPVFLVISTKPACIETPNYSLLSELEIHKKAHSLGVKPKIYTLPFQTIAGTCIAQAPAHGTQLSQDKSMLVYVSQGITSMRLFPSLRGRSLEDVCRFCDEHSFRYQIVYPELFEHEARVEYTVIDQRPFAGSFIDYRNPPFIQVQVA